MVTTEETKKAPCGKLCVKPLTKDNIIHFYLPIHSITSYSALAVNIMNPSLVIRVFPKHDVTNILLLNTLLGSGLYLYNRPHMARLSGAQKLTYSAFGAAALSLGSVLAWAIVRSVLPQSVALRTACGLGSGLAFLKIACNYVSHLDSLAVAVA